MTTTKTKSVPALSVIPKGYWRNAWNLARRSVDAATGHIAGPGFVYGDTRFISAELAEQSALEIMAKYPCAGEYLGPEFFPG